MDVASDPRLQAVQRLALMRLALVVVLLAGAATASWFQPAPFSDWEYYWLAASEPGRYERGGVLMFVLGLFKQLGLTPAWTSLLFNLPLVAGLLWFADRLDRSPGRPFALMVAAGCVLLAPYLSVVQLDFAATVLLGIGMALLFQAHPVSGGSPSARRVVALCLIAIACSTRPQFVLVLPLFATLLWVATLVARRRLPASDTTWTAAVLVAAAVCGFAVDSGLRALADRSSAVRSSSGVTLYAGLLASPDDAGCGRWSPAATRMARADMDRPVAEAVAARLSERSVGHWLSVMRCKAPAIVLPGGFAMGWVLASPNVAADLGENPDARSTWLTWRIAWAVDMAWRGFTLLGYAAIAWVAVRAPRPQSLHWMPVAWVASFWAVHLVFEIQERYFLGTFLLIPLLVSLAWAPSRASTAGGRFDQG